MSRHRKLTRKFAGFPMFKLASSGGTFPITSPFTTGFTGLETDQLALDLQFAADKTLTARKGPTPVFTRGSTGRFVGSDGLIQSAAINAPRFDHDPVTGVCKGLLMEEPRTNLCVNSNLLTSVSWLPTATTVATDAAGPDGTTAYEISETTANSAHSFVNSGANTSTPSTVITAGVAYTQSIFLKKSVGSVDWVQLTFTGAAFVVGQYANFNLSTGTVGNSSGVTSKIEQFANGWYRCSIIATATSSIINGNAVIIQFINNANTTVRGPTYTGSTANKILVAMGQLEAGAFLTSYIPTTTASVIRSADVCSISGSGFTSFYNTTEGSFATSSIFNAPATVTTGQVVFDINDTTTLNRTRPVRNATNGFLIYANTVGGVQDVAITGSTAIIAGSVTKISGCMKANDFTVYLNNVSQGVDTTAIMQSAPTTFTIGDVSTGVATRAPINGTIASMRYYKKRLANAKLQALTV